MDEDRDPKRSVMNSQLIAAEPPIHVETYPTHTSLSWTGDGIDQFVAALQTVKPITADAPTVINATTTAGQVQRQLCDLDTPNNAINYLRVDPPVPWTLSWERRTEPVVSMTGSPSPETCQTLHIATTACMAWDASQRTALSRILLPS